MSNPETALTEQIDAVMKRLQALQRDIAGTRQPASQLELAKLGALGRDYARLQRELQAWYQVAEYGEENDDRS